MLCRLACWLLLLAIAALAAMVLPGAASRPPDARRPRPPHPRRKDRASRARRSRRWRALFGVAPVLVLLVVGTAFRAGGSAAPRSVEAVAPAAAVPPAAAVASLDALDDGSAARTADVLWAAHAADAAARWTPLAGDAQVVALYGYPNVPVMGLLGAHDAPAAARLAQERATALDALNGPRRAVGALHLIVAVAQPLPMADGSYLDRLDTDAVAAYVEAAREAGVLLFLDVQCGLADPLAEVARLQPFLAEPFVHLALDPEFAMRARGGVPGQRIGSLDAHELNAVAHWLGSLAQRERLPPKLLVVHQFRLDMLTRTELLAPQPGVELVIDMDGWGSPYSKLQLFVRLAHAPYAQRSAIKLFEQWDAPLLSMGALLALPRPPDLVIIQ